MATTQQGSRDDSAPKASDAGKKDDSAKTDSVSTAAASVATEGDQKSNASKMVGYRGEHVGAKEAAIEAAKAAADAERDAIKAATPAEAAGFTPVYGNQVPQEGALVETPPQPVPPPHTEADLREMDHSPRGYREPSVAAGASGFDDYDMTVHPKSRVDDPSKPL